MHVQVAPLPHTGGDFALDENFIQSLINMYMGGAKDSRACAGLYQ